MNNFLFFLSFILCCVPVRASAEDSSGPQAIYNQIKFLSAIEHAKIQQEKDLDKLVASTFNCNDDCQAQIKLRKALDEQADTVPVAAFFVGLLDLENAQRAQRAEPSNATNSFIADLSKKARKRFTFASKAGIAAASWNMGVIYATDLGVAGSKLAATEWFARAGHQYLKDEERENALAVLEKIESLDSKHPESMQLRRAIYPSLKKK